MEPNNAFKTLFTQYDSLLNIMGPMKKITLNEQRLAQRPWITKGILKSMKIRDSLYKKLAKNHITWHKYLKNTKNIEIL